MDGRLRSLEGSVSSLHRRLDEKLDVVVSVENKREEQEKIFTDILKKILNSKYSFTRTFYDSLFTLNKGLHEGFPPPQYLHISA